MTASESVINAAATAPRGAYPHAKRVGDFIFVSGTSSRRPDNSIAGAELRPDGTVVTDIRVQTAAVLDNIERILVGAGASLADVVDITSFLIDMTDFAGYNEVYGRYFASETGPSRTTVAVHQLPHPDLVVEIKAVAFHPRSNT